MTKDEPPYAIVGGNQARIIRYMIPQAIQKAAEASKWWTYSIDELQGSSSVFGEPVSSAILQRLVLAHEGAHVSKDTND